MASGLVCLGFLLLVAPGSAAAQPETRIVGGYYPESALAPWVTSIERRDGGRCTASLIAPDRVLTAAHCVVGHLTPSEWTVRVGVRNRNNPAEGQTRRVTGIALHPQVYLPDTGEHTNHAFYDIAVMFLDQPSTIAPATIGTESNWSTWGTALGWGHYNLDHAHPLYDPQLRALNLSLGSDSQCAERINEDGVHYYSTIHVCGYDLEGDECITHGDSGGPLVVGGYLIGVTSFFPLRSGWGPCGVWSMVGFAWVAGPTIRDWPLSVPNPTPATVAIPTPAPNPACSGAVAGVAAANGRLLRAKTKLRKAWSVRGKRRARKKVAKARQKLATATSYSESVCP